MQIYKCYKTPGNIPSGSSSEVSLVDTSDHPISIPSYVPSGNPSIAPIIVPIGFPYQHHSELPSYVPSSSPLMDTSQEPIKKTLRFTSAVTLVEPSKYISTVPSYVKS